MHRSFALALIVTFLGVCVHAQDSEPLEEITVRAERPLGVLRAEVREAEETLFDMFNEFIAERDFKINCERHKATGSQVGVRVCEPRYVGRLEADATQRGFLMAGSGDGNLDLVSLQLSGDATMEITREDKELLDKMLVVVQENPEVMSALADFLRKKRALDAEMERRWRSDD